jgi:hypothetical protein
MKKKFWLGVFGGWVMGLLLLSMVSATWAAATAVYDLSWNTFAGGGASFTTAGNYTLGASIGQSAAGLLIGGTYNLNGGFWQPGKFSIHMPLVVK